MISENIVLSDVNESDNHSAEYSRKEGDAEVVNFRDIIGKNIKTARKLTGMTQKELAQGIVTRNMLSLIESSKSIPSVPVLYAISERLGVSCDYLLSSSTKDIARGMLEKKMPQMRVLFEKKKYKKFLEMSEKYSGVCSNELEIMSAQSHLCLAKTCFDSAELEECIKHLSLADMLLERHKISFADSYISFLSTVSTDLINGKFPSAFECFGSERFIPETVAYFFIINLIEMGLSERAAVIYDTLKFSFEPMRYHINSRLAASKLNFERAKELLEELISKSSSIIPAPFMAMIYNELELYCTKTGDYSRAYECVIKKQEYIKNTSASIEHNHTNN